jgi:arabinofuranosyltransferase
MSAMVPEPASRLGRGRIGVVIFAVLAAAAWGTGLEWRQTAPGFPLDDTWIHLQFARNVAEGYGFSFNAGVPSSGSTAPLWTLVLSVPLLIGLGPVVSAKALGIVLVVITAVAAASLTRRLSGSAWAGLLAGVAVGITPRMAWAALSGMEVPLYAALVTLAMLLYVRAADTPSAGWLWAVAAGLAGWARPETFVAGGLLVCAWLLGPARVPGTRRLVAGWWRAPAIFALVVAGFLAFNLVVGGRPLPNTYYAKHYGMGTAVSLAEGRLTDALLDAVRYPVNLLGDSIRWQASHDGLLFGAALVGLLALAGALGSPAPSGGRALLAVLILSPIAKGLAAPQPPLLVHDGRYIAHLLVLGLVVCACGAAALARLSRPRWLVPALAVAGIAHVGGATFGAMRTYADEVQNINDLQVRTGRWLSAHTAPDARVATNDIGAIAFFSRRFILDTEGLVSPDAIWDKRMWRIDRFLIRSRPDVVVIFPDWYPYLTQRPIGLTEVGRIAARKVIAGGEALVIYRPPWSRPGRLRVDQTGR